MKEAIANTSITNIANTIFIDADEKSLITLENEKIIRAGLSNNTRKIIKPNKPIAGDKAPWFSVKTLKGEKVTLADAL